MSCMNICKQALSDYQAKHGFDNDEKTLFTNDGKYCIFFYNINEVRMGAYLCTFAIYGNDNLEAPLVTMTPNEPCTWYVTDAPFFYAPESDLIITVYSRDLSNCGVSGMPYLLINPTEQIFAIIPFDFTSIYYAVSEKSKGVFEITEKCAHEIERCVSSGKHVRQTGRIIVTEELEWYPLKELSNIRRL